MPQIYAALHNKQVDHLALVIKMEGIVVNQHVSILIDLGYNLNYINPNISKKCSLQRKTHEKMWSVQVSTGAKNQVIKLVELFPMALSSMSTTIILLLGSYTINGEFLLNLTLGMSGEFHIPPSFLVS